MALTSNSESPCQTVWGTSILVIFRWIRGNFEFSALGVVLGLVLMEESDPPCETVHISSIRSISPWKKPMFSPKKRYGSGCWVRQGGKSRKILL